ncbi:MAG: sugar ABC transporter permease [Angelakisella sp.]
MKKTAPIQFIAAILLVLLGLLGTYVSNTMTTVTAMRASVLTAEQAAIDAAAALEATRAAVAESDVAVKKVEASNTIGTPEGAAVMENAKKLARDLKNAEKKAKNKQIAWEEAAAAGVPAGSAIDSLLARGSATLRYPFLLGGILLLLWAVGNSAQTRYGVSLSAIISGSLLTVISLAVCFGHKTILFSYGVSMGDLLLGMVVKYRGILLLTGLLLVAIGVYISPKLQARKVVCVLFLAPALAAFCMTIVIPFLLGIFYSMTDWTGVAMTKFVGLQNYQGFFSSPEYLHALIVTIKFTVINMILVNVVAFALSMLVTGQLKGKNFYRAGFFVPNLIGGIVLGYIWQFIFNYVIPPFAQSIGVGFLSNSMLADPNAALGAIVVVSIWQYAGYIMMIYVAAIQGVPTNILEAAQVDGANKWIKLTKITIPMIANAFTVCIFLTLVNSFKQFDLNYALTNGGPAALFMEKAVNSTELLALNIYRTAFALNNMAVGQAKAVIFFIMLVIVSLIQVTVSKRKEVEM